MMQNIQKFVDRKATLAGKPRTLRGLAMQLDAAVWMVIVSIIVAAVVVGAMHMTNKARFATARLMLAKIRRNISKKLEKKMKGFLMIQTALALITLSANYSCVMYV